MKNEKYLKKSGSVIGLSLIGIVIWIFDVVLYFNFAYAYNVVLKALGLVDEMPNAQELGRNSVSVMFFLFGLITAIIYRSKIKFLDRIFTICKGSIFIFIAVTVLAELAFFVVYKNNLFSLNKLSNLVTFASIYNLVMFGFSTLVLPEILLKKYRE